MLMTDTAESADFPPAAAKTWPVRRREEVGPSAGSFSYRGTAPALPWHRHDMHQLEYAVAGIVEVRTAAARYRLPSRQALWIPAGLAHRSTFDKAETVSVFFEPSMIPDTAARARVLPVAPILREMMIYAVRWPLHGGSPDPVSDAYFAALARLVHEWLDHEQPFHLPASRDPLVAAIMRHTDRNLGTVTLGEVCAAVAVSERTLRRRFYAETGMTWRQYLLHSRLLRAMTLLVQTDATVLGIATDVGFDSVSAFARAFRDYTGQAPSAFRRERRT
jgi:AraC-like DNA-binding protein